MGDDARCPASHYVADFIEREKADRREGQSHPCVLPAGHDGPHQDAARRSWDEPTRLGPTRLD